jgi:hypothetical protein
MNRLRKITGIAAFGAAMLISAQAGAGVLATNTVTGDSPEMGLIVPVGVASHEELIHKFSQNMDTFSPAVGWKSTDYRPGWGTGAMTSMANGCVLLSGTTAPMPESGFNQAGTAAPGGSVPNTCDANPVTAGVQTDARTNYADSPQTSGITNVRTQAGNISVSLPHAIAVGTQYALTNGKYEYLNIDGASVGKGIKFTINSTGNITVMENKFVQKMDIYTTGVTALARTVAGEQMMDYSTAITQINVVSDTAPTPIAQSRIGNIQVGLVQNIDSEWSSALGQEPVSPIGNPNTTPVGNPTFSGQDLWSNYILGVAPVVMAGTADPIDQLPANPPGWQN